MISHRACWDCEMRIDEGTFCQSCEVHRADGHEPVAIEVTEKLDAFMRFLPRRTSIREWCHGAGANGQDERLLFATPRPIYAGRDGKPKNPHVQRVDALAA